jgi:hypothetical protein
MGTGVTELSLLVAGTLLTDAEVLSEVLPQRRGVLHSMMLLRSQQPASQASGGSAANPDLSVLSNGELTSRVQWRVHTRNLKRKDSSVTSPRFDLHFGNGFEHVPFRISLLASDNRSFAQSHGRGYIQLKCLGGLPMTGCPARVRTWVSSGSEAIPPPPGQSQEQEHCFATSAALKLPRREFLDFGAFVDAGSSSFVVEVEIVCARVEAES